MLSASNLGRRFRFGNRVVRSQLWALLHRWAISRSNPISTRAALAKQELVLQLAEALLVILATHLLLPFAQSRADDSRYLRLARDLKFEGGELYRT